MKLQLPWISRRDLDATVEFYEDYIEELTNRILYLEQEREIQRQASLTPEPTPITVLDLPEHDEEIARWEGEGGASWTA
jgi:hypothetical protein